MDDEIICIYSFSALNILTFMLSFRALTLNFLYNATLNLKGERTKRSDVR